MLTCQNLQEARAVKTENVAQFKLFIQKMKDVVYIPGTENLYPNAFQAAWIAVTDAKEEGTWLDWYTDDKVDIMGAANGEIGKYLKVWLICILDKRITLKSRD